MLRAVLFDLDNTLVARDEAFRGCVEDQFPDAAVRAELLRLDGGGRGDRAALLECWQRRSGEPMDQIRMGRLIAGHLQPDHELLAALSRLSQTVKLGIITNGSGETQRHKLRVAGLAGIVPANHIWISGEVGKAKPDPEIFLLAGRTLGETPEHCLHIGDHANDDLAGATRAGMRGCLVEQVLNARRLDQLLNRERLQ
ncbi:MAG TPA: HAD family hydrolase [Candidatus Sulfotelmatobacter sp.]|jgi:HAD superfamily hydrolase (TIGR01509 family)|nr:HAD family hydrolase [Candidatus Sulfotelmatobacter sp.]